MKIAKHNWTWLAVDYSFGLVTCRGQLMMATIHGNNRWDFLLLSDIRKYSTLIHFNKLKSKCERNYVSPLYSSICSILYEYIYNECQIQPTAVTGMLKNKKTKLWNEIIKKSLISPMLNIHIAYILQYLTFLVAPSNI